MSIKFFSPFTRSTSFTQHTLLSPTAWLITKVSHYIIFTHLFFLQNIWNLHYFIKTNYFKNHDKQWALKQAVDSLSKCIMQCHSDIKTFLCGYVYGLRMGVLNTKGRTGVFQVIVFHIIVVHVIFTNRNLIRVATVIFPQPTPCIEWSIPSCPSIELRTFFLETLFYPLKKTHFHLQINQQNWLKSHNIIIISFLLSQEYSVLTFQRNL